MFRSSEFLNNLISVSKLKGIPDFGTWQSVMWFDKCRSPFCLKFGDTLLVYAGKKDSERLLFRSSEFLNNLISVSKLKGIPDFGIWQSVMWFDKCRSPFCLKFGDTLLVYAGKKDSETAKYNPTPFVRSIEFNQFYYHRMISLSPTPFVRSIESRASAVQFVVGLSPTPFVRSIEFSTKFWSRQTCLSPTPFVRSIEW